MRVTIMSLASSHLDRAEAPLFVDGLGERRVAADATTGELLQQIPSFAGMDSPNTAGVTSRGGGQINPDLRGLGASRTLVLIDGRMHVPTATTGFMARNFPMVMS